MTPACITRSRRRQKAAAFVESILAIPIVLFLGLATVQYGQLLHAKANLTYAAYEAARTGSTEHGDPAAMKRSLARALTPLYGGGKSATQIATSFVRAQASLADAVLQIVSPTKESFDDFGKYDSKAGKRVIRNDNLMVASGTVKENSGQNIQDANLLKIRIVFAYKPEVPLVGRILSLYTRNFGATGEDAIADGFRARGLIPVVVQSTVRMQSDPWENDLLVSNPGKGNDGVAPPSEPIEPVDPTPDPEDAADPPPPCEETAAGCTPTDPDPQPDPECDPLKGMDCTCHAPGLFP